MKECANCGFNDEDYGCTCPYSDKWYACPIESEKPENVQALKEYAEWVSKGGIRNDKGIRTKQGLCGEISNAYC